MTLRERVEQAAREMLDEVEFCCGPDEKPHANTIADAIQRVAMDAARTAAYAALDMQCDDGPGSKEFDDCLSAAIAEAEKV